MIYSFTAPPPHTVRDMIHVTRHTLMSRVMPGSGLCHDCSNMSHVRPCHYSNRSLLMSLHCLNLGYHNCNPSLQEVTYIPLHNTGLKKDIFIFIVAPTSYHLAKCCMDVLRGLMKFTDHPVWRRSGHIPASVYPVNYWW